MGIQGIYKEIGPGQRIALSKLAVDKYEETGRPFRIAIDTSIWLFQIQAGKGGTNPALRTFYYRLLRLISLQIHPVFVFDGPNKPPFKRNKRTGPNVASIPEFLAKQLLRSFGFPIHLAPGEAEAECALLQREGIVDAVLSEDVDTLMFGSIITLRNWTSETTGKTPTHVNLYDAIKTKNGASGLDREGMILVALMSGGDYVPEGIPGCGPKTACEAARAGYGRDLCRLSRRDEKGIKEWKERLAHELRTNESKYFKRKHAALVIPEDFPRIDILGYYTHPAVSSSQAIAKLRTTINWDQPLDFPSLRRFAGDAFDWAKISGAKKFIRNLAPALLIRELRLRGEKDNAPDDPVEKLRLESELITSIHGRRTHITTDNTPELRVAFRPIDMVTIDLDAEEPDDEILENDSDEEIDPETGEAAPKKRAPSDYDPTKLEKIWVFETYVKVGVPLKTEDWEETQRKPKKTAKPKSTQGTRASKRTDTRVQGTIVNQFTVSKPVSHLPITGDKRKSPSPDHNVVRLGSQSGFIPPPSTEPTGPVSRESSIVRDTQAAPGKAYRKRPKPDSNKATPSASQTLTTTTTATTTISTTYGETEILDLSASPRKPRETSRRPSPPRRLRTPPPPTQSNSRDEPIEIGSSPITPKARPPPTITEWIRRSQSVTPRNARRVNIQPEPIQHTQLEPMHDEDSPDDDEALHVIAEGSPTFSIAYSPPLRQLSVGLTRHSHLASSPAPALAEPHLSPPLPPVMPSTSSLFSAHSANPMQPASSLPKSWVEQTQKQAIKIRNSLEGGWKYVNVEELDLTSPSHSGNSASQSILDQTSHRMGASNRSHRRHWRASEISIVDLTDD